MGEEKKEWIYKTTAKKKYKITDYQIIQAIDMGLVEYKEVRNPHYSTAPPSLLLKVEDLEKNIEKIRSLEKYSEAERERRRYYRKRMKARDEISFFCPRCNKKIRALRGSYTFEEYFEGEISKEEAIERLKLLHYRHVHTYYEFDEDENFLTKKEREEFEHLYWEYKHEKFREHREELLWQLREIRSIGHERKKEHYNKIAKKLIEEDFGKG